MTSLIAAGIFIISVFYGFKYIKFLDENDVSKSFINKASLALCLDMCLYGVLSFVCEGILSIVCSFLVGLCFGFIMINQSYLKRFSQDQD